MSASLLLAWRDGVSAAGGAAELVVRGPGTRVVLRRLPPAVAAALGRLAPPGEDESRLVESVRAGGGPGALPAWYYWLGRLAGRGLIRWAVRADDRTLATLLPVAPGFVFGRPPPDRPLALSRFAYLRREGNALVLESPLAHARVVLDDPRSAALAAALAEPGTPPDLAARAGLPTEAAARLLALFAGAGMLDPAGSAEPPALRSWEFHDLLFHARSRKGRSDAPFGATYRFAGRLDPPPALASVGRGELYDLYRPDPGQLGAGDPPLAQVQERRRSIRTYGPQPISARELGEFLYRVARAEESREVEVATPNGPVRMEFAARPYPAGGGLHELEFYAAVHACDGLAPGLYRYDPRGHRLERLRGRTPEVEQLLGDAAHSAGIPADRLQVQLILAARFQRVAWKYASIAYALTLKHVGVVYQTMYLAATAMGLAPCAVGGGDADLFARAAGLDYHAETSVGEFLLGSRSSSGPDGREAR